MYRCAPKPIAFRSRAQLQRRCHSCLSKRVQSKIDSQSQRKDSFTHAKAAEPGKIPYVLYAKYTNYNDSICTMTDTNSAKVAQDYAVRLWLYHSHIT